MHIPIVRLCMAEPNVIPHKTVIEIGKIFSFIIYPSLNILSFVSHMLERKPVSRLGSDWPSQIPIENNLFPVNLEKLHDMFPDQFHHFIFALRFPVAQVDPDGDRR